MGSAGLDRRRLELLPKVIEQEIAAKLYHGLVLKVARRGETVVDLTIGSHDIDQKRPLQSDSVFSIFSVTKAFTNLLVMQAIERGQFALTTPISDLLPEFKGHGREKILMWHLLSHQAGFPILFEVRPGWYIDNSTRCRRSRSRR